MRELMSDTQVRDAFAQMNNALTNFISKRQLQRNCEQDLTTFRRKEPENYNVHDESHMHTDAADHDQYDAHADTTPKPADNGYTNAHDPYPYARVQLKPRQLKQDVLKPPAEQYQAVKPLWGVYQGNKRPHEHNPLKPAYQNPVDGARDPYHRVYSADNRRVREDDPLKHAYHDSIVGIHDGTDHDLHNAPRSYGDAGDAYLNFGAETDMENYAQDHAEHVQEYSSEAYAREKDIIRAKNTHRYAHLYSDSTRTYSVDDRYTYRDKAGPRHRALTAPDDVYDHDHDDDDEEEGYLESYMGKNNYMMGHADNFTSEYPGEMDAYLTSLDADADFGWEDGLSKRAGRRDRSQPVKLTQVVLVGECVFGFVCSCAYMYACLVLVCM
jgi:hypothetical protein